MDWMKWIERVDADTARAFVSAARHLIDAVLLEAQRVQSAATPAKRDYARSELSRGTPAGGWISYDELRATARAMAEAVAAEKWTEGLVFSLRLLHAIGGGL